MANEKKAPVLPKEVADKYELVGGGFQKKFITKPIPELGRVSVNLETLSLERAAEIVDHVPFLKKKASAAKADKK